ncbi:hypothetical protein [Arthrobacter sp. AZCC_0090]|uniref:hypothetical protein n=1 Tax=Arthrobacter sp. AZCC_0090 TaxID=2735881 RepID=UPI00161A5455|nr:hypothetical protein [Arthrobacter sp. AZCC_0090]MBB6405983.1 putative GH25 family protein [Arthrobacter sp. AZCC_0090]
MNDIHIIADFHASDTSDMESQLNHAVTVAREKAIQNGTCGILVMRDGHYRFTVALAPHVPVGLIYEHTPGLASSLS